jgi:replicative DNA helicase
MTEINSEFDFNIPDNFVYEEDSYHIEDQDLRLLKGIICSERSGKEFASSYTHDLFLGDSKDVAKSVLDYIRTYKASPTKRTLLDFCGSDQKLKDKVEYTWQLLDNIDYDIVEFNYDLEKLKDRHTKYKIESIKRSLDEPIFDNIDLEQTLRNIKREAEAAESIRSGKRKTYTQKTMREFAGDFKSEFLRKREDPDIARGIQTGYSYLDYVTGGLQPAELIIVGAETGGGKSMLLNNMAVQMWMQKNTIYTDPENYTKGCNVLYFSLEMPFRACYRRTIARVADLPVYGIRDATISNDKLDMLSKALKFTKKYPNDFEIVDIPRGATIDQIEERYLAAVDQGRAPDVIVVDYLGLMDDPDAGEEDWLKLGLISGKLHEFARMYDVIVLTAVQLNRPTSKTHADSSELIGLHRIGRSALIMTHANIGIQIETRKDENTYSDLIYHIIKNRDGELGKHILSKKFQNATIKDICQYIPPTSDDGSVVLGDNSVEDLTELLDSIGWNDK